jgi:dynein heavy chain 1
VPQAEQFSSQIKVVSFPEGAPFEALCSLVKDAVKPYMECSLASMQDKKGVDATAAGAGTEIDAVNALIRKLTQLQQNIALPEVVLQHHPAVRAAVHRDAVVKVEDFKEADPQDPKLLNALEKLVQRWVREIKKITEHTRDIRTGAAPGKALQEIRFWLGWESALGGIKEKLDGREVRLTIELLRQGNRFHVTTGFEQDTGLAQAMEKATDYSPLMKDFGPYLERLDSAPTLYVPP